MSYVRIVKGVACIMASMTLLCGCADIQPGVARYTTPDPISEDEINTTVVDIIEKAAAKKGVKPELSDDFVSRYMDIDSFEELKQRTISGIAAAQDTYNMTENEISLWQEVLDSDAFSPYVVDDPEEKMTELYGILNNLASNHSVTLEEYADFEFDMSMEDIEEFVDSQAQKFTLSDVDAYQEALSDAPEDETTPDATAASATDAE